MPELIEFNALPAEAATAVLTPACASPVWLTGMVGSRPYADLDELTSASHRLIESLAWPDVLPALAAHPKIGAAVAGHHDEAEFSRAEQSGAATATEQTRHALRLGNLSYQRRFGYLFLICATGLSASEMLAQLHERLGNDDAAEHKVVRTELSKIVTLRLRKAFG